MQNSWIVSTSVVASRNGRGKIPTATDIQKQLLSFSNESIIIS
jgi:hypothetical protein